MPRRPALSRRRPPVRIHFLAPTNVFAYPLLFPEPRRAAVAIIIRVVPSASASIPPPTPDPPSLAEFFDLPWVNDPDSRPEILFLRRDQQSTDDVTLSQPKSLNSKNNHEVHVAFPGGRTEAEDEGGLYTGLSSFIYLL